MEGQENLNQNQNGSQLQNLSQNNWQSTDTNYNFDYGTQNYQGYNANNYGTGPQNGPRLGIEVASLVLGILSIVFICCGCCASNGITTLILVLVVNLVMAILAIVFAANTKKVKQSGMATGGLVCGIIGIIVTVIITAFLWLGVTVLNEAIGSDWMTLSPSELEERLEHWINDDYYDSNDYDDYYDNFDLDDYFDNYNFNYDYNHNNNSSGNNSL